MQAQGDRLRISLSVGVASIDKCTGVDDLMSTAENGLYQAKHMGRDMVVLVKASVGKRRSLARWR